MFNEFIAQALLEAKKSLAHNDIPVGALIVNPKNNQIIAAAHNMVVADRDSTAHAELRVLAAASKILNTARLDGYDLYCSLEPCAMCAAAISLARIRRLYFAVEEPKFGAVVSNINYFESSACQHAVEYYYGFSEGEAQNLMKDFFQEKRS